MANVTYEKRQQLPSGNKLIFYKQGDHVISEPIILSFVIDLNDLAPKPMDILLKLDMLHLEYEFLDHGPTYTLNYNNKLTDFVTPEFKLKIKIVNPMNILEQDIRFKVTVIDVDENVPFPSGGNYGFYSWNPVPPPTGSLINNIPSNLI